MDFLEWDSTNRIIFFAALFLITFLAGVIVVSWTWDRVARAAWAWRIGFAVLAIAAFPPITFGASVDPGAETLFNTLAWIAIGATVVTLFVVSAYLMFAVEQAPTAYTADAEYTAFDFDMETADAATTTVGAVAFGGLDDATRAIRPNAPGPAEAADAYFVAKSGKDKGRQFAVANGNPSIIGRSAAEATIVLADERVSGSHGQVRMVGGNYTYVDMNSTNGSFLIVEGRSEPIRQPQVLVDGDEIRLGHTVLAFVDTRKKAHP